MQTSIAEPPVTQRNATLFAHESEEQVARLLNFYEIRWEYEPRSFLLDGDGQPAKRFTPDFYLPDYEMFVEVTTMKPALASRKNRKLRRLRELYPDVKVKLLAVKDIEALGVRRVGSDIADASHH